LKTHNCVIMTETAESGSDDVFVNVRMSRDLVEKLDSIKCERGTNRTKEVVRAVEFLVSSLTCPRCGALNPQNGVQCAVCGTKLGVLDELIHDLQEMYDRNVEKADDIHLRITRTKRHLEETEKKLEDAKIVPDIFLERMLKKNRDLLDEMETEIEKRPSEKKVGDTIYLSGTDCIHYAIEDARVILDDPMAYYDFDRQTGKFTRPPYEKWLKLVEDIAEVFAEKVELLEEYESNLFTIDEFLDQVEEAYRKEGGEF